MNSLLNVVHFRHPTKQTVLLCIQNPDLFSFRNRQYVQSKLIVLALRYAPVKQFSYVYSRGPQLKIDEAIIAIIIDQLIDFLILHFSIIGN